MRLAAEMDNYLNAKGGILFTPQAKADGFPPYVVTRYISLRGLIRVSLGVYVTPDFAADPLYLIHLRFPTAVFSHDTALAIHGLLHFPPSQHAMTVVVGIDTWNMKKAGIRVFLSSKPSFSLGAMEVPSSTGHPIRIYNKERSLCDIIQARKNPSDNDRIRFALQAYLHQEDRNIPLLLEYARERRVGTIMQQAIRSIGKDELLS